MVSVGSVSLEEVWGEEMSAVMVEADTGTRLSLDVGLVVVVVVGVVELVSERTVETRDEEVTGVSGAIVEIASGGGGVVLADDGIADSEVWELVVMDSPVTSATEIDVVDICDMLVAGEEATVMTGMASLSVTRGTSTETMSLESGTDILAAGSGDVAEIGFSLMAAGRASNMLMEGVVTVEPDVTERLGAMDSEGITEEGTGGSVGEVVSVGFPEMVAAGNSGPLAGASGMEGLMLRSVSVVGAAAAVVGLAESVHISVSEGGTVLDGGFESGSEFEIVVTEGGVVVETLAAVGLCLVGVFVSPSSIWDSSFSGVLRPDVVGGGPGLRTGFGSKAGFPADSCADTLGRI